MKIFGDGFSVEDIKRYDKLLDGFTSNPSLMKKLGVTNYLEYCKEMLQATEKPVSLEILSDDYDEIIREATVLQELGDNVYVKVPITNSLGHSNLPSISHLVEVGVNVNVTAVFSYRQIDDIVESLPIDKGYIISVFAGRIADSGVDPQSYIKHAVARTASCQAEVLWASTREVLNICQANKCSCDIITVSYALYQKYIQNYGKDLDDFSLETVKIFKRDGDESGYSI